MTRSVVAAACLLIAAGSGFASEASGLLEEALYAEQTLGDRAGAIEIYRKIVADPDAERDLVSRAHLRLGLCLVELGESDEARSELLKVVERYGDLAATVARAREALERLDGAALALQPPPWKTGEHSRIDLSLPGGRVVGVYWLSAVETVAWGRQIWRLEQRVSGGNQMFMRADVDRETFAPARGEIRGYAGAFTSVYGEDALELSAKGAAAKRLPLDGAAYDDGQMLFLMRQLPLRVGYRATLQVVFAPLQVTKRVELEVVARETIEVPIGAFDAFHLQINVDGATQDFWISDDASRRLLRMTLGGVTGNLAEVQMRSADGAFTRELPQMGARIRLPAGWHDRLAGPPRESDLAVALLAQDPDVFGSLEVSRRAALRELSVEQVALREAEGAGSRHAGYVLRESSWRQASIAAREGIEFVGDFTRSGAPWAELRAYALVDDIKIELIFRAPIASFDAHRAAFDEIIRSMELR